MSEDAEPQLVPTKSLLPEYEAAVAQCFYDTVNAFMRAQDPVLDKFATARVTHIPEASADSSVAFGAHSGPMRIEMRASLSTAALLTVDTDAWVAAAYEAAADALDQLMPQLFAGLDRILQQAGRTISNNGDPWSWDSMINALDAIDMQFDDNGEPSGLTFMSGPEIADRVRTTPMTLEQEKRWDEVLARKREEFNARRRRRTLD